MALHTGDSGLMNGLNKNKGVFFGRKPGLSIIESGIVLVIFTTLVTLALAGASRVLGQSEVAEEATNLAMLSSGIRATRTGAGYSADIMEDLIATNALPANMAYDSATKTLSNRWTGNVTFTSLSSGSNFQITYANIPTDECAQLLLAVKRGVLRSVGPGATPATWTNIGDLNATDASDMCDDGSGVISWSSQE